MYLEELFHWLMTVVDSLPLEDKYKDESFKAAVDHVASCLMVNSSLVSYIVCYLSPWPVLYRNFCAGAIFHC